MTTQTLHDETITAGNLAEIAEYITPLDMRAEIMTAIGSGAEATIRVATDRSRGAEALWYCYFPAAGRGGVANGGET